MIFAEYDIIINDVAFLFQLRIRILGIISFIGVRAIPKRGCTNGWQCAQPYYSGFIVVVIMLLILLLASKSTAGSAYCGRIFSNEMLTMIVEWTVS